MNAQEINKRIGEVLREMEIATDQIGTQRRRWQEAKAIYENEYAKNLLITKTKNPTSTVQEIKGEATNLTHAKRMEFIGQESRYKRIVNKLKMLNTEFEALKEESYNFRAEANAIRTGGR